MRTGLNTNAREKRYQVNRFQCSDRTCYRSWTFSCLTSLFDCDGFRHVDFKRGYISRGTKYPEIKWVSDGFYDSLEYRFVWVCAMIQIFFFELAHKTKIIMREFKVFLMLIHYALIQSTINYFCIFGINITISILSTWTIDEIFRLPEFQIFRKLRQR